MSRIVLTGATGTAGSAVLQHAVNNANIAKVFVLSRREPWIKDQKIQWIQHTDFNTYPDALLTQLKGCSGVIWCLGATSVGVKEKDYRVLTYDYAMNAAKAFSNTGDRLNFVFCSGEGTSWQGASRMFARVKGETERDLAQLEAIDVVSLRPGALVPTTKKPHPALWDRLNPILGPVVNVFAPNLVTRADDLAKVLIDVALHGPRPGKGGKTEEGVYSNKEILAEVRRLDVGGA